MAVKWTFRTPHCLWLLPGLLMTTLVPNAKGVWVAVLEAGAPSLCAPSTVLADLPPPQNLTMCFLIWAQHQQPDKGEGAQDECKHQQARANQQQEGQEDDAKQLNNTQRKNGGMQPPTFKNIVLHHHTADAYFAAGLARCGLWVVLGGKWYLLGAHLPIAAWTAVCLGYSADRDTVWAVVDGSSVDATQVQEFSKEPVGSGGLCVGHPGPTRGPSRSSFTGLVAAVSFTAGFDNGTPIGNDCVSLVTRTQSSLTLDPSWRRRGSVLLEDYAQEELCNRSVLFVLLSEPSDFRSTLKMCQSLGGRLPAKQDIEEAGEAALTCDTEEPQMWLGGEEVVAAELTASCPVLLANGTVGRRPCLSELRCGRCRVPAAQRYTLFGVLQDFDRYYLMRASPNGSFYFEGREVSSVRRQGEGWVLESHLHRRWWRLGRGALPLGRHVWHSADHTTTLTFTSCSVLQFSTHDGACLPRSRRCDGHQNSPDGSDEEGCQQRLVQTTENYDPEQNPAHDAPQQGTVHYRYVVFNINQISTVQGSARLDFAVYLSWLDPRLNFWDVNRKINFFPCSHVWTPELGLYAGYKQGPAIDVDCYNRRCFVQDDKKVTARRDLQDPLMGRLVSGEHLPLKLFGECRVTVPCRLQVQRFPFGRHQCNGTFYLRKSIVDMRWRHVSGSDSVYSVPYGGPLDLLDFHLVNITGETAKVPGRDGRDVTFAVLTLHLASLYEYHLLSTFAPSALMFLVSYSTLFFSVANFNERIMVSLTALLVLAEFFSQATATHVKTPYFKLLDIWYATLISLCFVVIVVNVFVNALEEGEGPRYQQLPYKEGEEVTQTPAHPKQGGQKSRRLGGAARVGLLLAFLVLVGVYVGYAKEVL